MTKMEVVKLCERIKNFYPKFEYTNEKLEAWYERLQYADAKTTMRMLNEYVDSDTKDKPPALGSLMNKSRETRDTATLNRECNVIEWSPEEGKKEVMFCTWDDKRKLYVDETYGYSWGFPGE